jgi:choline dehydrogenase-like flavoprotein
MDQPYDYIIVGAGSAGCVLANKLSENPAHRVLLIESGPADRSVLIHMPRGIARLLAPGDPHLWIYPVATGGNRPPGAWLQGKTLGGSSSVNGMVYIRGRPADYDGWEALGCEGWGWDAMRRCFLALEDHELGESEERGVGGPLKITVQPRINALSEAILDAAAQTGTPRVADVNDAPQGGAGYQTRNIWHGRRQSAATAFLRPALRRPNLSVLTDTDVIKVAFEGRRATGVVVRGAGGERLIAARGEVILAAGAVGSPKLLQLSGVGEAGLLQRLGIPLVADSPGVGRNLQEHYNIQIKFRPARGSLNAQFSGLPLLLNTAAYVLAGRGPMTHAAHEICAFVKTRPDLPLPDAQLGIGLYSMARASKGRTLESTPGFYIGGYPLNPTSRGELRIASADPKTPPYINANYLETEADRAASIAMVRHIRKIASAPALKPFILSEAEPGPAAQSDADILQAYYEIGTPGFHGCGTCRMGGDAASVVDTRLRVRGAENLRVVDASIFPTLISGNTNGPTMAVALRASGLILDAGRA